MFHEIAQAGAHAGGKRFPSRLISEGDRALTLIIVLPDHDEVPFFPVTIVAPHDRVMIGL